eukprot:3932897-Rhodomonas_salina.1
MNEKDTHVPQLAVDPGTCPYDLFKDDPILADARSRDNHLPPDYDLLAPGIVAPRMGMPHPLFDVRAPYPLQVRLVPNQRLLFFLAVAYPGKESQCQ